jgi:hypothetical protein
MKYAAALVAICALSQTALAQTSECRAISDADTRLACYDRIARPASPSATVKPALRTAPAPNANGEASTYVDSISAEDALMNAKLRNICRGC